MTRDRNTQGAQIDDVLQAIDARGADLTRHTPEMAAQITALANDPRVAAALVEARKLDCALRAGPGDEWGDAWRDERGDGRFGADIGSERMDHVIAGVFAALDEPGAAKQPKLKVIDGGRAGTGQSPLNPAHPIARPPAAPDRHPSAPRRGTARPAMRWAVAASLLAAFALGVLLGSTGVTSVATGQQIAQNGDQTDAFDVASNEPALSLEVFDDGLFEWEI